MNQWSHSTLTVSLGVVGLGPAGRVGASYPTCACGSNADWLSGCILYDMSRRELGGRHMPRPPRNLIRRMSAPGGNVRLRSTR